jgi:hypothetical protein
LGQRRGLKNPWAGEEDVFLFRPQNGLNGLILNWCTGGCWFTIAIQLLYKKFQEVFKLSIRFFANE